MGGPASCSTRHAPASWSVYTRSSMPFFRRPGLTDNSDPGSPPVAPVAMRAPRAGAMQAAPPPVARRPPDTRGWCWNPSLLRTEQQFRVPACRQNRRGITTRFLTTTPLRYPTTLVTPRTGSLGADHPPEYIFFRSTTFFITNASVQHL